MEKNTNKKLFAGLLALSCAFILGGCDAVESLPANYNDPILENASGNAVNTSDNIMGEIYNKISGNKNNTVLQIVLDELAEKKFGTYTEMKNAYDKLQDGDRSAMNEYISNHSEIFERKDDDKSKNKTKEQIRENRFVEFYKDVERRISEEFYNLITSGNYNDKDTGMFNEEKLWKELKYDFWDLKGSADFTGFKNYYVTNELTKENAVDENHLNISLYSNSGKVNPDDENSREARGYIEKKLFPQILKEKLVEEYIYNNNYSSLGRSYARNVNFVKVSYDSSSLEYAKYVMQRYADENIAINHEATGEELKLDFSVIKEAINGFENINILAEKWNKDEPLIKLYTKGDFLVPYSTDAIAQQAYAINAEREQFTYGSKEDVTISINEENVQYYRTVDGTYIFGENINNIRFFGDTKLGSLMESYKKAVSGALKGETNMTEKERTEYNKYSNGDSMANELRTKILELAKNEIASDGWYVKSSGISELPSAIKDRLFNINVANDLDKTDVAKGAYVKETNLTDNLYQYQQGDTSKAKVTRTPYVRNIQGRKLVMAADSSFTNPYNFIYNESDSAFYICQVLEAPSNPKLNKDKITTAYTTGSGETVGADFIRIENIAREICKILSTKDSFYNNAYTKYLEEYTFSFNDTSLYEHFKNSYPDLFEDEE